jgi:Tfp pilus assembly protein PilE
MKVRSGFSVMEIGISMVLIAILAGASVSSYTSYVSKAKAEVLSKTFEKVVTSLSEVEATRAEVQPRKGSVFFNTVAETGTALEFETELKDLMVLKGMKLDITNSFTIADMPSSKITVENEKGIRFIRITGISGEIALRVSKAVNNNQNLSVADGLDETRRVSLWASSSVTPYDGVTFTPATTGEEAAPAYFSHVGNIPLADAEEVAKKTRITLIYMVSMAGSSVASAW